MIIDCVFKIVWRFGNVVLLLPYPISLKSIADNEFYSPFWIRRFTNINTVAEALIFILKLVIYSSFPVIRPWLCCSKIKAKTIGYPNFSIKDFLSKCAQICSFLRIWSHLLKKSLMENFIFCAVLNQVRRLNGCKILIDK